MSSADTTIRRTDVNLPAGQLQESVAINLYQHEPVIVFTVIAIKLDLAAIVAGEFSDFVIRDLKHLVGLQVIGLPMPFKDLCRWVLLWIVPQGYRIADRRRLANHFELRAVPALPGYQPGNACKKDDKTGHQGMRPALARKMIIDGQAHEVTGNA